MAGLALCALFGAQAALPMMRRVDNASRADSVVYSLGDNHLSICTCAKCGSTSVFEWLYQGIYGENFADRHKGPPWVQNALAWEAPPKGTVSLQIPDGGALEDITIVRDPLERYFSAWKSKMRCNRSDTADGNRMIPELLKVAGLPASKMVTAHANAAAAGAPVKHCLSFENFALALRHVHVRGAQEHLNMHLLPQTLTRCRRGAKRLTIEQFAEAAPVLSARFDMHQVTFPHSHAEEQSEPSAQRSSRAALEAELCAIVGPEYAWMGATEEFQRRCPAGSYRPLAETRRLALFGSSQLPSIEVLNCPGKPLLDFQNADKVVREDALVEIFARHFTPKPGEPPDLVFLPTSCGWEDPQLSERYAPRLGYFGVAAMPWAAFPSGAELVQPLLKQKWPEHMAVLSVEVPSYAASWDGESDQASVRPLWKWGKKHPPAAAMVVPYISASPPAIVPSLDERPALACFVGTVYAFDSDIMVGRAPVRTRLMDECHLSASSWKDCIFISDVVAIADESLRMNVSLNRVNRDGFDGVYDSQEAMDHLSTIATRAYSKARFAFCPWGDTLSRKSIFDALMQGSIPVLFEDSLLHKYAELGPIEDMTVVLPLRELTAKGSGALNYLRSLPEQEVQRLHDNVVKWRESFHLPESASEYVPGDAVDAIAQRLANHFKGTIPLPNLPLRHGFKQRMSTEGAEKKKRHDEAEKAVVRRLINDFHATDKGIHHKDQASAHALGEMQLRPFPQHASCRRSCACSRNPLSKPRDPAMRFFLHEKGAFDFGDLELPPEDLLDEMPIEKAEHLSDHFLVNALRAHPHRTQEKGIATVHVLAALPFASWVLEAPQKHEHRMSAMAEGLKRLPRYLAGEPFVLVMSHWNVREVLGPELLEVLRNGRAVLATADSRFPDLTGPLHWLSTVVMPYRAHHMAEADAFARETPVRDTVRSNNFMFHGMASRKTRWPELRATMVKILQKLPHTDVFESTLANLKAPYHQVPASEQSQAADRAVASMKATAVCPVPEGDTWTSRRLFDALATGCVPLLIRGPRTAAEKVEDELDLPFRASIDWSEVTLGVMELSPEHSLEQDLERLRRLVNSSSAAALVPLLVDTVRAKGRVAFREHLAVAHNPQGVATAMLRELSCSNVSVWGSDSRHPLTLQQRSPLIDWDERTVAGFGPFKDVVDQTKVNWSLAGSFEALPYLGDRMMVMPKEKLLLCGIEKNGITLMNLLMHAVLDLPPWRSGTEFWFRASPDLVDVSANQARELLRDPSWRSAIVYRDPAERFVSAYRSKCDLMDKDGREHCHRIFKTKHPTPKNVAAALLKVTRAPPEPRCTRFNAHWAPQACFCTGLRETFPLYTHPIEFGNMTAGMEAFFSGRVSEASLHRVKRLLRDKKAVAELTPGTGAHVTGDQEGVSKAELDAIREELREVYAEDYEVLPLGKKEVAEATEATEVQVTDVKEDEVKDVKNMDVLREMEEAEAAEGGKGEFCQPWCEKQWCGIEEQCRGCQFCSQRAEQQAAEAKAKAAAEAREKAEEEAEKAEAAEAQVTDANDGSDSEEPMAADHPLAESPHAAREPTRPNGWKPEDEVGTAAEAKTEASVARGTWSYEGAPAQNSAGQDAVGCEPWCNGKANAMGVAYTCKTIPECRSCGMCGKAGHSTEQDVDELAERERMSEQAKSAVSEEFTKDKVQREALAKQRAADAAAAEARGAAAQERATAAQESATAAEQNAMRAEQAASRIVSSAANGKVFDATQDAGEAAAAAAAAGTPKAPSLPADFWRGAQPAAAAPEAAAAAAANGTPKAPPLPSDFWRPNQPTTADSQPAQPSLPSDFWKGAQPSADHWKPKQPTAAAPSAPGAQPSADHWKQKQPTAAAPSAPSAPSQPTQPAWKPKQPAAAAPDTQSAQQVASREQWNAASQQPAESAYPPLTDADVVSRMKTKISEHDWQPSDEGSTDPSPAAQCDCSWSSADACAGKGDDSLCWARCCRAMDINAPHFGRLQVRRPEQSQQQDGEEEKDKKWVPDGLSTIGVGEAPAKRQQQEEPDVRELGGPWQRADVKRDAATGNATASEAGGCSRYVALDGKQSAHGDEGAKKLFWYVDDSWCETACRAGFCPEDKCRCEGQAAPQSQPELEPDVRELGGPWRRADVKRESEPGNATGPLGSPDASNASWWDPVRSQETEKEPDVRELGGPWRRADVKRETAPETVSTQPPTQPWQPLPQPQLQPEQDRDDSGRCIRGTSDFDKWFANGKWFGGKWYAPRKATEADCEKACGHANEQRKTSAHYAWCIGYEFVATEKGTCKLFDDCGEFGGGEEGEDARRKAAAERAFEAAAREDYWQGRHAESTASALQPVDMLEGASKSEDQESPKIPLDEGYPLVGAPVGDHPSNAHPRAESGLLGSNPEGVFLEDEPVEVCFVTMVHDKKSLQLAAAQTKRMRAVFTGFRWIHRTFACNSSCHEGWDQLPEKTYAMLATSLSWHPKCQSVAKLDADGFFCLNRLSQHFDLSQLDRAYVGKETQAMWNLATDPGSKYQLQGHDVKEERASHLLPETWYMQGGAYLVGRRLIEYVVRQPFSELLTLSWEDWSLGTWISSAAMTVRKSVPASMECHAKKLGLGGVPSVVFHHCDKSDFSRICEDDQN